jgi:ribonuclease D
MLISSQQEADALFDRLASEDTVAIDSEFQWTTTYAPIPALIQVATADEVHLLDPSALKDFTSFKNFLEEPNCVKIFHSCSQDLLLFNHMNDSVTTSLFDSQIANAFLSTFHQISYGKLVEKYTGEVLSKGSQRSNWLRRPLSPTQLEYAKSDVTWLFKCHGVLVEQLEETKRAQWHKSECDVYCNSEFYRAPEPEDLYKKFRGIGRLNRNQLAVLRELCAWRDQLAQKVDLRPKRLLADDGLFSIVYKLPKNSRELKGCRDVNERVLRSSAEEVLECINTGLNLEEEQKPNLIKSRPISKEEEDITDQLYKAVNLLAENMNMASALLLTRQTAKKITANFYSKNELNLEFLSPWRQDILEGTVKKVLNVK